MRPPTRSIKVAALAVAGLAAALIPASGLHAIARSEPVTVSADKTEDQRSYPALVGPYPRQNPVQFRTRNLDRCRAVTYCDVTPLVVKGNAGSLYQVVVILTWPGPDRVDDKGQVIKDAGGRTQKTNNDLDVALRDFRTTTIYFKNGTTSTANEDLELAVSPTIWHPEIVGFGDLPPNGVTVDAPPQDPLESKRTEKHDYFVTPYNFSGNNEGYTIRALYVGARPDEFRFEQGGGTVTYSPSTSKSFASAPAPVKLDPETLEPVKTPGSDGPVEEKDLVALKAEQAADTSGVNPWWIAIPAAVLVVGAAVLLFYLRTRRRAA